MWNSDSFAEEHSSTKNSWNIQFRASPRLARIRSPAPLESAHSTKKGTNTIHSKAWEADWLVHNPLHRTCSTSRMMLLEPSLSPASPRLSEQSQITIQGPMLKRHRAAAALTPPFSGPAGGQHVSETDADQQDAAYWCCIYSKRYLLMLHTAADAHRPFCNTSVIPSDIVISAARNRVRSFGRDATSGSRKLMQGS